MVREWILTILGLIVGLLFTGWAIYMILLRLRDRGRGRLADASENLPVRRRVPLGFVIVLLLIGLADSAKATKDLWELFSAGAHLKHPHPARPHPHPAEPVTPQRPASP